MTKRLILTLCLLFIAGLSFGATEIDKPVPNTQDKDECWCCVDGVVVQVTPMECKERGERCYPSKDEASRYCDLPPPPGECWCCVDGQVLEMTEEVCKRRGGRCYSNKDEAAKECR